MESKVDDEINTDFDILKDFLQENYDELKELKTGDIAKYIPKLQKGYSHDDFAIAVCGADGTIFTIGDEKAVKKPFCIQSCVKPFLYCHARKLWGSEIVHNHVGYEPTGESFNDPKLSKNGTPLNPMVNSGAIMVSYLINKHKNKDIPEDKVLEPADKIDEVIDMIIDCAGGEENSATSHIHCDSTTFKSEQFHGDMNESIAYRMRHLNAYGKSKPSKSQITDTLDLYHQSCSIKINTEVGAAMAATLANGGICPISGKEVFDTDITRDAQVLMFYCGMYEFSGEFGFQVGLAAKSGVHGCILIVVPGEFGMCIWSPPLDEIGNSVRGIELCKRLANRGPYNYHLFRHVGRHKNTNPDIVYIQFMDAILKEDMKFINRHIKNMDVNRYDYDKRTPLHIACSEGSFGIIKLLLKAKANVNARDRWGNLPIDDIKRWREDNTFEKYTSDYTDIVDLLEPTISSDSDTTDMDKIDN